MSYPIFQGRLDISPWIYRQRLLDKIFVDLCALLLSTFFGGPTNLQTQYTLSWFYLLTWTATAMHSAISPLTIVVSFEFLISTKIDSHFYSGVHIICATFFCAISHLRDISIARHPICATFQMRDISIARHPNCATFQMRDISIARYPICATFFFTFWKPWWTSLIWPN